MNFLPLKYYYRSLTAALLIPISVACLLCLYIYGNKVEQALEKRKEGFKSVSAQVVHGAHSATDLLNTMFKRYQQPLLIQQNTDIFDNVNQYSRYYYQHFNDKSGEIVGIGKLKPSAQTAQRWQQVKSLGPTFSSALALLQTLAAIAYVDESGFAYVKRHNQSKSQLLTAILQGRLKPIFTSRGLASSSLIKIGDESFFAIGRQREKGSSDYIILIYNIAELSHWLKKVSPDSGEYIFMNQAHQVIASSTKAINSQVALDDYWPGLVQHHDGVTVENNSSYFFMQSIGDLPIHSGFHETKANIRTTIIYEVALEFVLLLVFLFLMFSVFFMLNKVLFVGPVTQLMRCLGQDPKLLDDEYKIPHAWVPWFSKVKNVFAKNKQLVDSLQQANQELDEKVQLQSKKLLRSYEAKERHLALLNTMLNSVPDLIYFKNVDGTFLGCNKAYESYINTEQAALVGKQLSDFSREHEHISVLEQQVLDSRENVLQRIDTIDKSYQLTIAPFYNEQQQLLGTVGIGRDITQQQQALYALKASESKFRSAIEFAANSVMLLSLDHIIVQVNKAARKLFNSHPKLTDAHFSGLFDEPHWLAIKEKLVLLVENKKTVQHLTINQGQLASWLQISMSLVWSGERQHSYYVIHIQDVSALTKAKHDAERATLAKSRFIANLSHEIRTPLNAVLGLLNMMEEQGLTTQQKQQNEQAKQAANSLLFMLNRMLDFARVESEQAQLQLSPFSLVELIDTCESITSPLCKSKNIEFNIEVDPFIAPSIIGDFIRLQQILGNLLTNAVKFTQQGSVTLKIHLLESQSVEQQRVCFEVKDTGAGIDKVDQGRLFDAFTQGDESSTRAHQGVGLGLAIVKHAVALLGGEIEVFSEKGHGCKFFFALDIMVNETDTEFDITQLIAITSLQSTTLNTALSVFGQAHKIDIDEVLKYPIKLSGKEHLLIEQREYQTLLANQSCKETLISNGITIDVVNCSDQVVTSIDPRIPIKIIKSSALAQRLLGLNVKELSKPEPVVNEVVKNDIAGLLVLTVDDNQLNLEIIESVLQQAHINVITVDNAADAIELIQVLKPDLVLMDVQMPHIDGCQATQLIRQEFDQQTLPIFALTAHCEASDIERSLQSGMNKHLTKPVIPNVLLSEINSLNILKAKFYDKEFALNQFSLDVSALNSMNEKFTVLCKTQLLQLQELTSPDELIRIVHSIKGVAGNLGFLRLSNCALICERKLMNSNDPISVTINPLLIQLQQVIHFIQYSEVKNAN
ncbi:response regulator [Pseudoalteromonas sp. MMG010]|uniref:ATP-binding protein n=1 Tax=Pseudoalteromonas sp. MMG010 TaxID=2822685 RepID=UPI001B3A73BE|nr:ATP-binding protein [Pseudoalteromonas sp. MMG010]MBQ4832873.1 response regulator [Pseudoalteromonas sp. MMG010]